MQQIQVNTLISAIRSDASPQIAGFLYQFIVALDYCFMLSPGQSLFIEKYGDIAIKSDGSFDEGAQDVSIEVKMYNDTLDVNHHNLLNTLYNWLEEDFHFEDYNTLIIYTTQPFSENSSLKDWNNKTADERTIIVSTAYNEYLEVHQNEINDEDSSKHRTIKNNAKQMKRVLGAVKKECGEIDEVASRELLSRLLEKVVIIDNCKNLVQTYHGLFKYANMVSDNLREHFIQCMLGFVIGPTNMKNGWKIKYESFHQHLQVLTKEMLPKSIEFPEITDIEVNEQDYADALFVKKLKRIDFDCVTEAIVDYAKTAKLLTGEFKRPTAEKNLRNYQEEMERLYRNNYGNAKDELILLSLDENGIKVKSRIFLRNFYDACRVIRFEPFEVTKSYFSNGMCHYMANDKEQNIKWYLRDE